MEGGAGGPNGGRREAGDALKRSRNALEVNAESHP